jgi:undecaprenyl-diphosphatase
MDSAPGNDPTSGPLSTGRRVANKIIALDLRVQSRIETSKPPRWLRLLTVWCSRAGDGWIWVLAGCLVLQHGRNGDLAFSAAALAVMIEISLFLAIKRVFRRSRPSPATWHRLPIVGSFSCPSGHAATGFAVAAALGCFIPLWIPWLFGIAGAIAASRVVAGMHWVSDVLIGAVLGCCVGMGVGVMMS